jgi:NAD(P)-dependent dehydrogenase (short-subunit alcohol dehydrogenase family)
VRDVAYDHSGRVVAVTGAATGIGRATAEAFAQAGAAVFLLDIDEQAGRAAAAGRIVNIGSLSGQVASFRTSPAYAAAKAGVHGLTRVMAAELAPDGITVNAIAPSAVLTERIRQVRDQHERDATARSIPLGRYQDAAEVASWILFLASTHAAFVTGQTISVNGGRHMAQ